MSSENSEQCYSTCEGLEDRYCTSSEESEVWYSKPSTSSEPQCSTSLERHHMTSENLDWHRKPFQYLDWCRKASADRYNKSPKEIEIRYSKSHKDVEVRYCKSSKDSKVPLINPSEEKTRNSSSSSEESEVQHSKYGEDSHVQSGKSGDSEVVYNKPSEESFKWHNKPPPDDAEDWYNFCYNDKYNIRYDDSDRWYRKSSSGLGVRPKLGLKIQSDELQGSHVTCTCFDDVDWYKIYKMCKLNDLKMCKVKDLKMCKVKDLKKEKKYLKLMVHMGPHPILYNWIESEIGNVSSFLNDFRRLGRLPSPRCKDGPNSELEESQQSCTVHSGNVPQSPKDYVIVKLNEVLGKEATMLTLNAVAFTPPVTVLRTNTIKGNRKLLWRDLESHDVSCWMPQWSAVIIYQSIHFEDCFVAEMISQGRCIILYERQWQKIEVEPWCWDKNIYSAEKENLAQNTDNRKIAEGDATTNNVGELTLYYSAQGSISTLIVMALAPKEGEDVLELCAASSGKTSHIGAIMMNTGTLIANALQDDDVIAIEENNRLLGVNNCIVMSASPAAVARELAGSFNRILVDAPSSGVGVVSTDSSSKVFNRAKGLQICNNIQENLMINGVKCLKEDMSHNSYLLYTTCSLLVEENECVVDFILRKYPKLELVPTGIDIGFPGFTYFQGQRFHRQMHYTRRVYCHQHHIDGAFLAKFILKSKTNMIDYSETLRPSQVVSSVFEELNMNRLYREILEILDQYDSSIQKKKNKEARRRKKRKRKKA